jgi:hypothetical protein
MIAKTSMRVCSTSQRLKLHKTYRLELHIRKRLSKIPLILLPLFLPRIQLLFFFLQLLAYLRVALTPHIQRSENLHYRPVLVIHDQKRITHRRRSIHIMPIPIPPPHTLVFLELRTHPRHRYALDTRKILLTRVFEK